MEEKCEVITWGQQGNTNLHLQVSFSFPVGSWGMQEGGSRCLHKRTDQT